MRQLNKTSTAFWSPSVILAQHHDGVVATVSAGLGSLVVYLLGVNLEWFYLVVTFMVLDYLTGVSAAIVTGAMDSGVALKGIIRKVALLGLMVAAHLIDDIMGTNFAAATIAVTIFLVTRELMSMGENFARMGVDVREIIATLTRSLQAPPPNDGPPHQNDR